MNSINVAIFSLLLLLIHLNKIETANKKLPSFLKICHRNDSNINECVKGSLEKLRPLLSKGIPEFGIPSCEPLTIQEVVIDQGNGPVSVKSTYTDIKVYGPSDFELRSIRIDMDKDRVRLKLWIPHLELTCHYNMDGRILMMPIAGSGKSSGNYTNIDATVIVQNQRIAKDGEIYLNVKDFFVDFNIGHANIQLDNLFNGDKELGEAMNLFLNDNWKNVANEIKPVLEDTIANIFKRFANKIFHKYPLDQLLPP